MSVSPRIFWALFAAMAVNYLAMVGWSLAHLRTVAGGLEPFDLRPLGYSTGDAQELLRTLGQEGRQFYRSIQHRLDTTYPALFAIVMTLAFHRLAPTRVAWAMSATALAAAAFDYLENAAVRVLLAAGPDGTSADVAARASFWTQTKSTATSVALLALMTLLGRAAWRRLAVAGGR